MGKAVDRFEDELDDHEVREKGSKALLTAINGLATRLDAILRSPSPAPVVNVPPMSVVPLMADVKALREEIKRLTDKIPRPISGFRVSYNNGRIDRVTVER